MITATSACNKHRSNFSQFAGDRLLSPNEFDAMRLDAAPEIVDDIVACHHARSCRRVALIERIDGHANRVAD